MNAVHVVRHLAEPADVGADAPATFAVRNLAGLLVQFVIGECGARATIAAALEELAMHVDEARGSSLLVQIVDVLGNEHEAIAELLFDLGESNVCRIRLGFSGNAAAH